MYLKRFCVVILLISVTLLNGIQGAKQKKLPSFIKQCHISSSKEEVTKCVLENIEIFKPKLGNGIPEMKIPALNPLQLEEIVMDAPQIRFKFINISIFGCTDFDVKDMDVDIANNRIAMSVHFPAIYLESMYSVKGRLLVLDLQSQGDARGNYSDIYGKIECIGKVHTKKGQTFIDFNGENKLDLEIKGKPKMQFSNLFANNEELSRATQQVIDDNIEEIVAELLPVVKKIIGSFIFNIYQQMFNAFSLEELFLP